MRILFCQPTLDHTGSENSLRGIIEALSGEELYLLAGRDGPMREVLAPLVRRCILVDAPKLRQSLSVVPSFVVSFWSVFRAIRNLKREHKIDVLYINTLMFPQAIVAAFLTRCRCVVHIREVESKYPRFYYQLYLLLATALATRIVCVCTYILRQKRILWRGRLRQKARVIYNSSAFDPPPLDRRMDKRVRILTVSGLSRLKGSGDLLAVAKDLAQLVSRERFKIYFLGRIDDPELYKTLEERFRQAGLSDSIEFCGEHASVEGFYKEADLLLHPAHSDVFPRVLVEAANYSLPVITTDAGGCPEAVDDGKTGFVVPVGDTTAMATRVKQLMDDPELYKQMCNNAYTRYRQRYTRPVMTEQIRRVLGEISAGTQG